MAFLRCFEHSISFLCLFYDSVLRNFTKMRNFRFFSQKRLTNLVQSVIIVKLSARRAVATKSLKKPEKKIKKLLQKVLTKAKKSGIIFELPQKAGAK